MIQFGILGPLELLVDGEPVTLGGPRQRAVLARLLLEPRRVVAAGRLIDDVWDGRPPATAAKTLQKYVSELRKAAPDLTLLTRAGGYVLDVGEGVVDAHQFERLVEQKEYRAALTLWRGTVLADLADVAFVALERARLEELRLFAVESRVEADLDLGRHGEVIAELNELVDAHPLRERLTGLLMLALYRSGRQVEALRVFERHRRGLAEEIGVAPDAELWRLQEAILTHDPRLDIDPGLPLDEPRRRPEQPRQLTSFVGRTSDLDRAARALAEHRLVTFTGPGGVGKTRLAGELAGRVTEHLPGGVWTVDLAGVEEADLLPSLASALEVDVRHAADEVTRIVGVVAMRPPCLVVLDNCEHIVEPLGRITTTMLRSSDHLRVLATSRRPLGVDGELVLPVLPLAEDEAVLLFVDRARRARADDAEPSRDDALAICRRLDGLPMAIELAASQLRVMEVAEVVERLDDQLAFRGSAPGGPPRQRTLGDMVRWSYGLLSPSAQTTLARLGSFTASFTLAAAEWVGRTAGTERRDVLEDVTVLIDHSLLGREPVTTPPSRYRLLETVRLFAAERLAESGDEDAALRAHSEFFVALAREAGPQLLGPQEATWRHRLEAEEPNLHAALGWARRQDPVVGGRLAVALWPHWEARWREAEGLRYLDDVLAASPDLPPAERAWALTAAAAMGADTGEARHTVARAREAIDAQRAANDRRGVAEALAALGLAIANEGRLDDAARVLAEGLQVALDIGDPLISARLLDRAGFVAGLRGDHAGAAAFNRRELAAMTELGSPRGEATALRHLAISLRHLGDTAEAAAAGHRALETWERLEDTAAAAHVRLTLADIARTAGDRPGAVRLYDQALRELRSIGDTRCAATTREHLAVIAAEIEADDT
jgi:predicted ATPase/DNA-binding SARP family transcriptional activator